jgi:hypothetical protein
MKIQNFTIKYTDRKTINSNNSVKFEVNWPRGTKHANHYATNTVNVFVCPSIGRDVLWYTNVQLSVGPFDMSRSNLRTPWPIHFKFHRVIGIDGLTVCILYGEI